jgi:hypothetical protein
MDSRTINIDDLPSYSKSEIDLKLTYSDQSLLPTSQEQGRKSHRMPLIQEILADDRFRNSQFACE